MPVKSSVSYTVMIFIHFDRKKMKLSYLLSMSILVTNTIFSGASIAAEKTPKEIFSDATLLMQSHKFAEAIPLLEELKVVYPTETVFWNLGISASEIAENSKALQAWLAYRNIAPDKWQGRAKLIQTYQALQDYSSRDRERNDLIALWKSGTDKELSSQTVFCREQFFYEGRKIIVLEYFNPTGSNKIIYSFIALNNSGQQEFKISLGNYDTINQIALELGERPKDVRLYHLDLYRQNLHETYKFFNGQPSYNEIRELVLDVLKGKQKPISSTLKK